MELGRNERGLASCLIETIGKVGWICGPGNDISSSKIRQARVILPISNEVDQSLRSTLEYRAAGIVGRLPK